MVCDGGRNNAARRGAREERQLHKGTGRGFWIDYW